MVSQTSFLLWLLSADGPQVVFSVYEIAYIILHIFDYFLCKLHM